MKTLTKHGNSLALVIDKPILELLKINEHTSLELATDGQQLIVRPVRDLKKRKALEESIRKADELYADTFKALAG
jgi:antitoxin MazE